MSTKRETDAGTVSTRNSLRDDTGMSDLKTVVDLGVNRVNHSNISVLGGKAEHLCPLRVAAAQPIMLVPRTTLPVRLARGIY